MSQHLSRELADRYRRRTLSKPELIAADQHLASCQVCRQLLADEDTVRRQIDSLRTDLRISLERDHLEYTQLEAYVDQRLANEEREVLDLHFMHCSQCAEELRDLQAFKVQLEEGQTVTSNVLGTAAPSSLLSKLLLPFQGPWSSGRRWALAACAAVALAVGIRLVWIWQHKTSSVVHKPQTSPAPTPEPNSNPPIIVHKPEIIVHKPETMPAPTPERSHKAPIIAHKPQTIPVPTPKPSSKDLDLTLAFSPHILSEPSEPSEFQAILASVAVSEQLQLPRGFADLAVRRGGDPLPMDADRQYANTIAFILLRPVGTVVASTTPVFTWKAIPGAEGYRVQVNDTLQNPVESSPVLTDTSWVPTATLKRGSTYVWRIAIISGGVEVQQSALDVPQGRFQVLDDHQNRQLQEFKRAHPQEHFALGILLAHAGVLDEAVEQFRAVPPSDPNYRLAKKFEGEAQDLIVRQKASSTQ